MSDAAPTSSATDDPDSLDDRERALLDRQLEALGQLAEMGMALAAAITRQATAEAPESGADLSHAAMDFARVSRAVRLTFALQSRLIAEFKDAGSRSAKAGQASQDPLEVFGRPDIVDYDVVRRRQLRGVIEQLAEGASMERDQVERLVREAGERLEDDGFYHDLTERPTGEMVALICADIGLEPNWDQLADDWWARLEIERPPPGSPYAGWAARQAPGQAHDAPPALIPSG